MANIDPNGKPPSGRHRWGLGIVGLTLIAIGSGAALFIGGRAVVMTRTHGMNSRFAPRYQVNLEQEHGSSWGEERTSVTSRAPLRVAIAPVVSPERSLNLYEVFVDYLGSALGREAAAVHRRSSADAQTEPLANRIT